jgi:transcriptional regulator with PAS, ATPase and Fis domain
MDLCILSATLILSWRDKVTFEILHQMVGTSPAMCDVYRFIAKVAPTEVSVLIRGESGTGKELVARAIHLNSRRAAGPFIAINCAALPETLLESELFGHEKGAFTGATGRKKGRLEFAEGGTLFLDEISEIAPSIQAKLLRVLQEREFERLGGTATTKVDLRLVAATNRDLEAAIAAGTFRQDLYYRLDVVSVMLPPLRERKEDLPKIACSFMARCAEKYLRPIRAISPEALDLLMRHDWPGNVRELENTIERAVIMGSDEDIRPEDLPETVAKKKTDSQPATSNGAFRKKLCEAKRGVIIDALLQTKGNRTKAAEILGVHPTHLHRLIRTMDMRDSIRVRVGPSRARRAGAES